MLGLVRSSLILKSGRSKRVDFIASRNTGVPGTWLSIQSNAARLPDPMRRPAVQLNGAVSSGQQRTIATVHAEGRRVASRQEGRDSRWTSGGEYPTGGNLIQLRLETSSAHQLKRAVQTADRVTFAEPSPTDLESGLGRPAKRAGAVPGPVRRYPSMRLVVRRRRWQGLETR